MPTRMPRETLKPILCTPCKALYASIACECCMYTSNEPLSYSFRLPFSLQILFSLLQRNPYTGYITWYSWYTTRTQNTKKSVRKIPAPGAGPFTEFEPKNVHFASASVHFFHINHSTLPATTTTTTTTTKSLQPLWAFHEPWIHAFLIIRITMYITSSHKTLIFASD